MCRRKLMLATLLVIMPLCGCQIFQGNLKAQYVASCELFSATVNTLTEYRAKDKFNEDQIVTITALIHEGKAILLQWEVAINMGQAFKPDLFASFNRVLLALIEQEKKAGVK